MARVAGRDGRRHADGQPGPLERGPPADRRVDRGRGDRRRARGARLEPLARVIRDDLAARRAASGTHDVPRGLDWDLWLGPRETRPWHPAYAPVTWRGFWGFGGGALPDMAIHHLDPAFDALDLDTPVTVEATCFGVSTRTSARGGSSSPGTSPPARSGDR